ncbi:MAG TPA: cation:proton antiporter [Nitriliruptorales bacterium]|nr:cation:proton antiporter [Nitriliruptorales bacterium]
MLTPVGEHELLLLWLQLVLLLATARGLGALLQRVGQPAVVGELGAGVLLGPSLLGRLAPGLAERLFPGGDVESALLLSVAWLGIVLLLTVTGFETDLKLLRRLGRESAGVAAGSLVVPLLLGYSLGLLLPETYLGESGSRSVFALFIAVALSISALPVVAKILQDMRLMRRDFGQITVAAGMVNDLVGWLLLGTLIGVVNTGGVRLGPLVTSVAAITAFVLLTLSLGQRVVDAALRRARRSDPTGTAGTLTVAVLTVLAAGAVTHAIGMEAVIGAFVAGIVLGRSRFLPGAVRQSLEHMSNHVFAPIFFATAGLSVDVGTLFTPADIAAAAAVLAVAAVAKLLGSYAGGRFSGLSPMESMAAGVGLNARGAMEIVLAAIGLRLGVLNANSYTAVVLMAIATSMAAPALLRLVLHRIEAGPEEAARLDREELLATSVIANAQNVLLPTRGGANSLMAARMLNLVLQPDAHITVLTVDRRDDDAEAEARADRAGALRDVLGQRPVDLRRVIADDGPAAAILREAQLGYELMALGLNEEFRGTHELSRSLQRILVGARSPMLLVRRPLRNQRERGDGTIRRVLVAVSGTRTGQAAEEVGYVVAAAVGAEVDAVHVVSRPEGPAASTARAATTLLQRTRNLARRFGPAASGVLRTGATPHKELLAAVEERDADLLVLSTQARTQEGRPFLGHGTEYLLEHAAPAVVVVVFPAGAT